MLVIGLTGSIATGKSTVSSILSQPPYSIPIIDADILARKVVEPGTKGYNAIVKHFLPDTPNLLVPASDSMPENGPTGKGRPLNRPALGKRVFGDSDERKKARGYLNGVVHPAVRWEMGKAVLWAFLKGHWAVVLDVPLLFEGGLDRFCGATLVVGVRDPAVQMKRLTERDAHLSPEDAENRVKSQTDVRVKAARSEARGKDKGRGYVVWNDGSKEELGTQLEEVVRDMRGRNPAWWNGVLVVCPPLAVVVAAWRIWQGGRMSREWAAMEKDVKAKL